MFDRLPDPLSLPGRDIIEGLIRSVSPEYAEDFMNRWCLDSSCEHARLSASSPSAVEVMLRTPRSDLRKLIASANSVGYFPSYWGTNVMGERGKRWDDKSIDQISSYASSFGEGLVTIKFEPKYDVELTTLPKYLYHVTPKNKLIKIFQIGLVPKSYSKKTDHPDRVYMAFTVPDAQRVAGAFGFDDQALLLVEPRRVKGLRLFSDPNFYGRGCYALRNIPPDCLKEIPMPSVPQPNWS